MNAGTLQRRCAVFQANRFLTSVELFAGAGGLALGAERAGLFNIACVETDKDCVKTLSANRPSWNVINRSVDAFDMAYLAGKVDLLTGGPPCQSFSVAGNSGGLTDIRGTLIFSFAKAVATIRPRFFVMENVPRLLTIEGGGIFKALRDLFVEIGYTVHGAAVLDASDYGVPQRRKRLFVIGSLPGFSFDWPTRVAAKKTLRDALYGVPDSPGFAYSPAKRAIMDLVPPGGYWAHLPKDVQESYLGKSYRFAGAGGMTGTARRLAWDTPSLTMMCSPSQKQTERCHPDETRPLKTRECARIQTFPDEWTFHGGLTSVYRQIGNAVPVDLAATVCAKVRESIAYGGHRPRVINVKTDDSDHEYIGRGTIFGNPFIIGRDGDRDEVIEKFKAYFLSDRRLMDAALTHLKGKNLGCHCKPLACHGDVIMEYLYE